MNTARIRITAIEFSGKGDIETPTIKLELSIHGGDTFSAVELLPKMLNDISSLSYEVDF